MGVALLPPVRTPASRLAGGYWTHPSNSLLSMWPPWNPAGRPVSLSCPGCATLWGSALSLGPACSRHQALHHQSPSPSGPPPSAKLWMFPSTFWGCSGPGDPGMNGWPLERELGCPGAGVSRGCVPAGVGEPAAWWHRVCVGTGFSTSGGGRQGASHPLDCEAVLGLLTSLSLLPPSLIGLVGQGQGRVLGQRAWGSHRPTTSQHSLHPAGLRAH